MLNNLIPKGNQFENITEFVPSSKYMQIVEK